MKGKGRETIGEDEKRSERIVKILTGTRGKTIKLLGW